jgi:hypothetical protein
MELTQINDELTKREILVILKANGIKFVNEKSIRKCNKAQLIEFANPSQKEELIESVSSEIVDVVVETSKDVVVAEIITQTPEEIALQVAEMAKTAGVQEAAKPQKNTGPRNSTWIGRIEALIASTANQKEDGSYFFTVDDAASVMGVEPTLKCLDTYPGDWHPSFKGPGRACTQFSFRGKLRLSKRDPTTNGLSLVPLSTEDAESLMTKYNYKPAGV